MITVGDVANNPSTGLPWVYAYTQGLIYTYFFGTDTTQVGYKTSSLYAETKTEAVLGFKYSTTVIPTYTVGRFAQTKTEAVLGFKYSTTVIPTYTIGRFAQTKSDTQQAYGDGGVKINSFVNIGYNFTTSNIQNPLSQVIPNSLIVPFGTNWNYSQVYIVDGLTAKVYQPNVPIQYWS